MKLNRNMSFVKAWQNQVGTVCSFEPTKKATMSTSIASRALPVVINQMLFWGPLQQIQLIGVRKQHVAVRVGHPTSSTMGRIVHRVSPLPRLRPRIGVGIVFNGLQNSLLTREKTAATTALRKTAVAKCSSAGQPEPKVP